MIFGNVPPVNIGKNGAAVPSFLLTKGALNAIIVQCMSNQGLSLAQPIPAQACGASPIVVAIVTIIMKKRPLFPDANGKQPVLPIHHLAVVLRAGAVLLLVVVALLAAVLVVVGR